MTATQPAVALPKPRVEDIAHIVCCQDFDGPTFCGMDSKDLPHAVPGHEPECVVCADFADRGHCPKLGRCSEVDD